MNQRKNRMNRQVIASIVDNTTVLPPRVVGVLSTGVEFVGCGVESVGSGVESVGDGEVSSSFLNQNLMSSVALLVFHVKFCSITVIGLDCFSSGTSRVFNIVLN